MQTVEGTREKMRKIARKGSKRDEDGERRVRQISTVTEH
jgi:hypothetical protein